MSGPSFYQTSLNLAVKLTVIIMIIVLGLELCAFHVDVCCCQCVISDLLPAVLCILQFQLCCVVLWILNGSLYETMAGF